MLQQHIYFCRIYNLVVFKGGGKGLLFTIYSVSLSDSIILFYSQQDIEFTHFEIFSYKIDNNRR